MEGYVSWGISDEKCRLVINGCEVSVNKPDSRYIVLFSNTGEVVDTILDRSGDLRVAFFTITTDYKTLGELRPINSLKPGSYVLEMPGRIGKDIVCDRVLIPNTAHLFSFNNVEENGKFIVVHGKISANRVTVPGGQSYLQKTFMTSESDDTFLIEKGSREISGLGLNLDSTNVCVTCKDFQAEVPRLGLTIMLPTVTDGVEVEVEVPNLIQQIGKSCVYYPYDADGRERFKRLRPTEKQSALLEVLGEESAIQEVLGNKELLNRATAILDKIESRLPPSAKEGNTLIKALEMLESFVGVNGIE